MRLASLVRLERNARRLTEILGVLGKYGLADLLAGLPSRWIRKRLTSLDGQAIQGAPFEARVRMALSELGTTFIKLGQMLSTRGDLLSRELAHELEKLQEANVSDSPEQVAELVEAELGAPIDQLFQQFEPIPRASASIAQVHFAQLRDGRKVVLKVQHAGIQDRVRCDLDILATLADLAQNHLQTLRPYQPVGIVREFRRVLLRELDFQSERHNFERFQRKFANHPRIVFPAVHPALSTRKVLTLDLVEGIHGSDLAGLRASGVDLGELARNAGMMYLDMIFRDGFYHADPHPGNFILMPDGRLGVLDCGMVGRLDDTYREDFEDFLLAVLRNDAKSLTRSVYRLANTPPDLDEAALRSELGELASEVASQPLSRFDLTGTLEQVIDIVHRFHIVLPPSTSLLIKTLIMLEGTARRFEPNFSLSELIDQYRRRAMKRRLRPARWARRTERTVRDWDRLLTQLPSELSLLLDRLHAGKLEIHHVHRRLEGTVNRLVAGLLAASLLVSSSLFLSQSGKEGTHAGLIAAGSLGLIAAVVLSLIVLRGIYRNQGGGQD